MSFEGKEKSVSQRHQQKVAHEIHDLIKADDSSLQRALKAKEYSLIQHISNLEELSSQVLDITHKRDYYQNKLLRILKEIEPTITEFTSTIPTSDYNGPDPSQITNRFHATMYLRKRLLKNSANRLKIREMIARHLKVQLEWKSARQDMEDRYLDRVREMEQQVARKSEGYHPSKMLRMKKELTETRLHELLKNHRDSLHKSDQEIWRSCRALSAQLARTLREIKVPFFCTNKQFLYPQIKEDQEYALAEIQEHLLSSTQAYNT